VMVLSLAACGNNNAENEVEEQPEIEQEVPEKPETPELPEDATDVDPEQDATEDQPAQLPEEEDEPAETPEQKPVEEQKPEEQAPATDAVNPLDVLTNAWNAMGDEEKFPIGGGDSANMVMDAPGAFDIASVEELDALLGLSADGAAKIDAAASLMHMMNANTFTCGAYSVVAGEDVSAFITALKDNIQARQWMCGFPEKLVIVTVDNVVVSMFGNAQIIDSFTAKLGGTVVVDEAIQ
ncbi:MAG: hypothetical protein IKD11_02100, partial [Oscillospiraceae bacterium]|nr:hypothetical protein [Oscillospiraceae bacterium]